MNAYLGVLVTAFLFGVRHGIDWDHIAAITDITSSQSSRRRSVKLAAMYAGGHGLVVLAIGVVAVSSGSFIHPGLDRAMEKVVGLTLVLMGAYVIDSLIRRRSDFRMQSRWMLLFGLLKRTATRIRRAKVPPLSIKHEHPHVHEETLEGPHHKHLHFFSFGGTAAMCRSRRTGAHAHEHEHALEPSTDDVFGDYGAKTAVLVGMLHGIGAETPTQVLLFIAAAGVAGRAAGLAMVGAFVVGVLTSNALIALASAAGFDRAGRGSRPYLAFAGATATFSLVTGAFFLSGAHLPALLGG